jgi:hypothetical protein
MVADADTSATNRCAHFEPIREGRNHYFLSSCVRHDLHGKSGSNDWHVFMIFWEGKEELAKILGE